MDKRDVNVVGGVRDSKDIATVAMELTDAGFGDAIDIVPGPLMRATHTKKDSAECFSHMPLNPASTYTWLHGVMEAAFAASQAMVPDPELDLMGLSEPLWGHHSFRRFADTVARQTRHLTGASEQDIDMYFGWMEAFYSAKMQLHYESTFVRERRTAVTRMA